ncbi:type II toxin-antitoxin system VapC family toxin [Moorella sulfitireducens]|uniref:type II toxin-antitoxin system VapC family toxin n=1 Tax=Neomoorella sulfitireducens TaxID=2972948 RepID=UPI0021AD0560|nr:type II toxin-antitoxin system VapC family toxin [Moorella sulfitireducens]
MDIVADASAILCAYFPDELSPRAKKIMLDYALGRINLCGPRLLILELINACLVAARRRRISEEILLKMAKEVSSLQILWVDIEKEAGTVFSLSRKYQITAYDAAYIVSARLKGCEFFTADERLYNAVKHDLNFVRLLGEYE